MAQHAMNGDHSLLYAIGTVFLYVLSVITVQQFAAIATIFAGLATGGYTIYKWIMLIKRNKKNDEKIS